MSQKKNIIKGLNRIKKGWTQHNQFNQLVKMVAKISENITSALKKNSTSIELLQNDSSYKVLLVEIAKLSLSFEKFQESIKPIFKFNKIFYHHIKQQTNFSIVIITIPQGLQFSLHNHPEMLVFTKCIYGTILAQSMDITLNQFQIEKQQDCLKNKEKKEQGNLQKNQEYNVKTKHSNDYSKYKQEEEHYKEMSESISQIKIKSGNQYKVTNWQSKILESGDFQIILPQKKNIHRLVGKTNSIFLDILIPDYNQKSDYKTYEYVNLGKDKELKIRQIFNPKEAPYLMSFQQMLD